MSIAEIQEAGLEVSAWQGAQLQEVLVDGRKRPEGGSEPRSLRLGFFHESRVKWLVFDFDESAPLILTFPSGKPPDPQKIRRPMELFLRSAFVGRRLTGVSLGKLVREPQLELEFGEGYVLKFLVVPKFRNLWAIAGEKQISEFKPMEVPENWKIGEDSRPLSVIRDQWLASHSGNSSGRMGGRGGAKAEAKSPLHDKRVKLQKREKALEKVRAELESKLQHPARAIGEWIKTHQTLEIPSEQRELWGPHIEARASLAQNIERLFRLAKSLEGKREGTEKRLRELEDEVAKLRSDLERGTPDPQPSLQGSGVKDLFQAASAQGRKIQVADGQKADLTFYIGKNAKENLAILRKAQPFDYWLHVKDQPGAHGIIRRARGRTVTDQEFVRAATSLLESSLKRRAIELKGEAFDILIVECRFVRPIKGDRLGRVHYSNDRVMRVRL